MRAALNHRHLFAVAGCLAATVVFAPMACTIGSESDSIEEPVGTAASELSAMSREAIIARAQSAVGYSYYWAHGSWLLDGSQHGSCSGGCPNCTHSGPYGADCSGLVAKVWQVPNDIDVSNDAHPYSTYHFLNEVHEWSKISRSEVQMGDAYVYHENGAGHIFLYESGDPWGSVWAYECKGCNEGCVHNIRTAYANYTPLRRAALGPSVDQIVLPLVGNLDGSASSDIDGDGFADVCARHSGGVACARANGGGFEEAIDEVGLSNDSGWSLPQYYATIRMGDINGDGKADLCARGAAGVGCWLSDGSKFPEAIPGPAWSDADGWGQIEYWSTLRLADFNGDGKADLCARSSAGIFCLPSTGKGFGEAIAGPPLSNDNGWAVDRYYGTIRYADVDDDGKMDVCARHSGGFSCWLSDGKGFPTEIAGPAMSDENGWGDPMYWGTIRMGDVNADGKADVCARHSMGFSCWLSDGKGFPTEVVGPVLSNDNGWSNIIYWSTIRLDDINGDGKADLCARGGESFACWLSLGTSFGEAILGPDMGDAQGWNKPEYYSTFRIGDTTGDGMAEVCGRGGAGIVCWPFDGTAFGAAIQGPAWSDANGWADVQYYGTLQIAGGCVHRSESCNGRDDDCDGEIDEDGACEAAGSGEGPGNGAGSNRPGGDMAKSGASDEASGSCAASGQRSADLPPSLLILAAAALGQRAGRRRRGGRKV